MDFLFSTENSPRVLKIQTLVENLVRLSQYFAQDIVTMRYCGIATLRNCDSETMWR